MLLPVGAWLAIIESKFRSSQLFLPSNPVFTEMSLVTQFTMGNNLCKECCQVLPFLKSLEVNYRKRVQSDLTLKPE